MLAAYSGARMGELLGLRWDCVDLDGGTISIRRTLSDARGGVPIFGEPKTSRPRRVVALPPEAVEALRQHRDRQSWERHQMAEAYQEHGLVFATSYRTALGERNVIRAFKAALKRAGIGEERRAEICFHDLRHAHATVLVKAGAHPKTISARLGHSSIGITMDLYAHAVEDSDREAALLAQQAFRAVPGGN